MDYASDRNSSPLYCGGDTHPVVSTEKDLLNMSPEALKAAARPLLSQRGLLVSPRWRDHEDNVAQASYELLSAWKVGGHKLDDRVVQFGEYWAAKLVVTLLSIDARQQPELYDSHRGYHPDRAAAAIDELVAAPAQQAPTVSRATLEAALRAGRIAQASQAGVLHHVNSDAAAAARGGGPSTARESSRLLDRPDATRKPVPTSVPMAVREFVSEMTEGQPEDELRDPDVRVSDDTTFGFQRRPG